MLQIEFESIFLKLNYEEVCKELLDENKLSTSEAKIILIYQNL